MPPLSFARCLFALVVTAPLFAAEVSAPLAVSPAEPPVVSSAEPPAADQPQHLQFGSFTIYSENDDYFAGTDQYYTAGTKLSLLSAPLRDFLADPVPPPAQWIARGLNPLVPAGTDCKLGLSLGQNIYTPVNIHTPTPDPTDRPYAAWLYVGVLFQSYNLAGLNADASRWLDAFEVNAGMVGPAALGEEMQNGVHRLLGYEHALGWSHQIHNEPGLDLDYERKWRFQTTGARTGLGAQLIPHLGACLGNVFTYANAGLEARAGWKLPSDFGTDLIHPSGDTNSARPDGSVFLFGSVEGQAVARDITLQGNIFEDSPSVPMNNFVADLSAGLGLGSRHWQLTYTQDVRTREFTGQLKPDNFGSISVTFYY